MGSLSFEVGEGGRWEAAVAEHGKGRCAAVR